MECFAPVETYNLPRYIVEIVVTFELANDGLLSMQNTVDRRIAGEVVFQRLMGGGFDMIRGIKIRLAGPQPDDIVTRGAKLRRAGRTAMVGDGLIAWTRSDSCMANLGFPFRVTGVNETGAYYTSSVGDTET